jgi:hypothetical protein
MDNNKSHDLFDFMSQISRDMADEYERIRKRTTEDPGTAGDQGEENWATLLREWLPPTYQIVTKGRLISYDGKTSPQVDVLVLKPSYPKKLLDKKLYLAAGVAAAFECKTTLTAAHVKVAVENCAKLKSLYRARKGSPFRELRTPLVFGLLAHSHNWKAKSSNPLSNIEENLRAADLEAVTHPRLSLDLLCVADLATWTSMAMTFFGPAQVAWRPITTHPDGYAMTSHIGHSEQSPNQQAGFTPIGVLISYLMQKLAWEDVSCRDLADYYRLTNLAGAGMGLQRLWTSSIYSDEIRNRVISGMLSSGVSWEEWSVGFT